MPDEPREPVPPLQERHGRANELIGQIVNPTSMLNMSEAAEPGYIVARLREYLAAEARYQEAAGWAQPAVYGRSQPAVVVAMSRAIPWPAHATGGLMPGDPVDHPRFGAGTITGFDDDEWAQALPLVAQGRVKIRVLGGMTHWVPAATLTRSEPAAPCVDQTSPF